MLLEQPIPRLQHQPAGAVFAELAGFVVFEDAEGFGGVVVAVDVGGVENVAHLVAGQAVESGVY